MVLILIALLPNLVEEVLRIESPVQAHFRVATRDTELDGVKIPAGAGVGVVYGCCNLIWGPATPAGSAVPPMPCGAIWISSKSSEWTTC